MAKRNKANKSLTVHKLDTLKRDAALKALREFGTVVRACQALGIARQTWYNWLEADEQLRQGVVEALEANTEDLESEAIQRAKDGSDTLLIFLLKSRRPEVYRDQLKIVHGTADPKVVAGLEAIRDAVLARAPLDEREEYMRLMSEAWRKAVA